MKLDDFSDQIEIDLSWRKKEISELFGTCQNHDFEVLRKSLLLIIYSHWEGFIKQSSKLYLRYISGRKLTVNQLTMNYKAIMLKGIIAECTKSQDVLTMANELTLISKLDQHQSVKFKLKEEILRDKNKTLINTKDNLSPKVLNSFYKILGIKEKSSIERKKKYLDESFLGNRNSIGHGSKISLEASHEFDLSLDSVRDLKDIIVIIMDSFKEDLQTYAEDELFLIKNNAIKIKYDAQSENLLEFNLKYL